MRKINLIIIFILILTGNSIAGESFNLSVAPSIHKVFGSTDYILKVSGPVEFTNGSTFTQHIKSELIFPLDALMAGLQLNLTPGSESSFPISLKASVYTNINAPSSKMKDSDWDRLQPFYDEWFSYTESDFDMKSGIVDVELRYNIISKPNVDFFILGGLRYQHIRQDILNFKGWAKPFDPNNLVYGDQVNISGNGKALLYKIDYLMPKIGMAVLTNRANKLSLDASLAFSRLSFDDYDDHLLRNKISTADGNGYGVLVNTDVRYQLKDTRSGVQPFLEFNIALVYINADGDQTQKWDGPDGYLDPVTNLWVGALAGDIATGIPHDIRSMQLSTGLRFGFGF